jgi:hypothetical protein
MPRKSVFFVKFCGGQLYDPAVYPRKHENLKVNYSKARHIRETGFAARATRIEKS